MKVKFHKLLICALTLAIAVAYLAIAQDYQPAGDNWITKWWALEGPITNTGGFQASAALDWLAEGTGGKLTQELVSTWSGLQLTKTTKVNLPDNGGNLGWTVITIDPNDGNNMSTAYGLADESDIDTYAIIVVDSPNERTTTIHPAHDDYAHIWLNGEKVYDNPNWTTGATIVTTPTEVSLKKGVNVLLYRCGESGGSDYFNLHFEASDSDLKIVPTMDDSFFEVLAPVEPAGKLSVTWGDLKRR
ncbi:TPA: hypothetical protein EYP66_01655 [Candidatus Poribacteria bacterium]|nr:hypothetical protein [Candidatus Poribacteria bacterium]